MLERSRIMSMACCVGMIAAGAVLSGCSSANVPKPRIIPVVEDPLGEVKSLLQGYAEGLPVSSEREKFETLIDSVRASDPEAAEWLGKTLAEIDAKPAQAQGIAKKALAKFGG